jgi:single-stranded-DNA-specific exonuclease
VLDGLHVINEQRNALSPGVRAVVNSVKAEHIEAETIAYCISPMLNAPGRLYNAGSTSTLKAVLCEDDLQSKEYVKKMCSINTERKRVVVEWMEKLQAEAAKAVEKGQVMPLVLYASGIPEGIVTGKLAEEYKTPTFVLSDSDETDILKGSGRSYGGINLKQLLDSTAEYLIEYGGHKAAAGIKVHKSQYSKMTKAMREALNDCGKGYDDTIFYNMVIDPEEIPAILNTMKRFEPFGEGVPKPVFVLTGFTPTAQNGCFYRTMGSNKEHIKFFGNGFDVVAFNMSGKYADMDYPTQMDFLGTIGENTFNGTTTIQFNVIDYRKS